MCMHGKKKNHPYCPKVDLPSFQKVVDTLTVRVASFYLSEKANKFSKDWGGGGGGAVLTSIFMYQEKIN